MVEATLNPGGGGIMDMAFAARGDFLALSGVDSARVGADAGVFKGGEGTLALVGAVLAAVVTVLVIGFAGLVFLIGGAFGVAGFFADGVTFLAGTAFFAGTAFLATPFFTTTGFLTGTAFFFNAGFEAGTGFLAATGFLVATVFFVATGFLTATVFLAGAFTVLALGFAAATLDLLLALLSLECFVDFNANLPTGWRRVR
jgi:hypothetical protein